VTSGTATLETALFKVPEVCVIKDFYKLQNGSYLKYISLVNLIMDEEVVTELIQEDFNTKRIKIELQRILELTIVLLQKYEILEKTGWYWSQ
jgi:lipid-A-disaccharide synthase